MAQVARRCGFVPAYADDGDLQLFQQMRELSITHNRALRKGGGQRYQLTGSFVSVGSER